MGQDAWIEAREELAIELGRDPTDGEVDLRIEENEAARIEVAEIKRKLWYDLTDSEKVVFLRSGVAMEIGIIAPSIVEDVAEAFAFRSASLSPASPDTLAPVNVSGGKGRIE